MSAENGKPAKVYCGDCRLTHDLDQLDVWFRHPDVALDVPFHERSKRVKYLPDYCMVDHVHFIRGWLQIPVIGWNRPHIWGAWAQVTAAAYRRSFEIRSSPDQTTEPAFPGTLATALPGYTEITQGLPLTIHMREPGTLPEFIVAARAEPAGDPTEVVITQEPRPGSLAHQQAFGVLPRDLLPWLHACL